MKKLLHGVTGIIVALLPLVWGGLLIYVHGFRNTAQEQVLLLFQEMPLLGVGAGLVLVAIGVVFLGTFGRPRPRPKVKNLSFDSENGVVSIEVEAVEDFLRKLGDEFGSVISLEPHISSKKNLITINLDVRIQTGTRIPELSQLLQNRVRESVRDGLGIAEVREIKVHVRELVGIPPASYSS
jgi:uncharacterized alkaline shock family protein YloU